MVNALKRIQFVQGYRVPVDARVTFCELETSSSTLGT